MDPTVGVDTLQNRQIYCPCRESNCSSADHYKDYKDYAIIAARGHILNPEAFVNKTIIFVWTTSSLAVRRRVESHDVLNRMTAYLYVENNQDSRNSLVMDVTGCCHPSLSGPRKTSESVSHHIRTCNVTAGHTGISQLQLCQKMQWQRQRRI